LRGDKEHRFRGIAESGRLLNYARIASPSLRFRRFATSRAKPVKPEIEALRKRLDGNRGKFPGGGGKRAWDFVWRLGGEIFLRGGNPKALKV
jgi:hypothetical protein